jgi:hypothetical protein
MCNLQADWSKYDDLFPEEFQKNVEKLLASNVELQLESAINKKMDMLIKMEDRLFLNPLAKVKNVPKRIKEEDKPVSKWNKFGVGSGSGG